ncbi:hypothetical protein DPMN_012791 [Dreissena polymorpha]|uniref:Uncharacterized protein n=1 Tax=Dreissena polymorpha TaxID=45954 RepID=A0A9D4S1R4_DREPO|nr:hypothetical protein DPMN_012791 [Dreissena polymorpha]
MFSITVSARQAAERVVQLVVAEARLCLEEELSTFTPSHRSYAPVRPLYASTVGPPSRGPWFRGETLTTEGVHADDECRSAIHNHYRTYRRFVGGCDIVFN